METKQLPEVKMFQGYQTLFVDEEPYVILGGEVHNSAASGEAYMEEEVWPNVRDLGMNTVVAPVYWECIEPKQGAFDFSTVDDLLRQARRENLRLVLLWFGLWKNAESMYVPTWMKRDRKTYFHCKKASGEELPVISPFCKEAVKQDREAFTRLMAYLKEQDGCRTVLMVQVENEIGLLGSERDDSPTAQEAFLAGMPKEVEEEFHLSGSWQEAFGEEAGEYFMAWAFAKAVEEIAGAGKREYPLPMYTNAWLEQFPWRPGTYPSGGPVRKMFRMWKAMAPSLFTLAPDIYVPMVPETMDLYTELDNPLFVPEVRKDAACATNALYAVFGCHGIGFSPFGVEELNMDPEKIDRIPPEVMAALNIDPAAFDMEGSAEYLKRSYELIKNLLPLYYRLRPDGDVHAFIRKDPREQGTVVHAKGYDIQLDYRRKEQGKPETGGVIFQLEKDVFLIAGIMCGITFHGKMGSGKTAELIRLEEGEWEKGGWKPGRILNGDEKMFVSCKDNFVLYRVELLTV